MTDKTTDEPCHRALIAVINAWGEKYTQARRDGNALAATQALDWIYGARVAATLLGHPDVAAATPRP